MSRFLSQRLRSLEPYTPGEQPKTTDFVKLNTNESPFPPSPKAQAAAAEAAKKLHLYSDPTCRALTQAVADHLGLGFDNVLMTNGSDEILSFAFQCFCDSETPAVFADITYGFYEVFARLYCLPYEKIPLNEDLSLPVEAFCKAKGTLFIANPNAPTGLSLSTAQIESILQSDPHRLVLIDEAYVDFGGESCIPLLSRYSNLLVTQTFSKSRSMAGARLGFGAASEEIIRDLNTVKYSTNPYNVNAMTMAAGLGVMADEEYTRANCRTVMENRAYTTQKLRDMGFFVTDSQTNFVFAAHPQCHGAVIAQKLKERKILVRHFTSPRIANFNRITIGTKEQMDTLLQALEQILKEEN